MEVRAGNLSLDPTSRRVRFRDVTARLTRRQARLLSFLIEASPRPYTPEELLRQVWGYAPHTGLKSLVRSHVYNVRKKLGADSILSRPGWGYYV